MEIFFDSSTHTTNHRKLHVLVTFMVHWRIFSDKNQEDNTFSVNILSSHSILKYFPALSNQICLKAQKLNRIYFNPVLSYILQCFMKKSQNLKRNTSKLNHEMLAVMEFKSHSVDLHENAIYGYTWRTSLKVKNSEFHYYFPRFSSLAFYSFIFFKGSNIL